MHNAEGFDLLIFDPKCIGLLDLDDVFEQRSGGNIVKYHLFFNFESSYKLELLLSPSNPFFSRRIFLSHCTF